MVNLAVFASGNGSNAENIITYFNSRKGIAVKLVACNRETAFVLTRAATHNVETLLFDKSQLNGPLVCEVLLSKKIDYIILAGFLLKVPAHLIENFPDRIINLHPALLPSYGGKGMYGDHVHRAVIENGENESGITIHLVNQEFDDGRILFQKKCEISSGETPQTLAQKIHHLEYQFYPKIIEDYIEKGRS